MRFGIPGIEKHARSVVLILATLYIVFWSISTIAKFYAMNSDVWDLGYAENLVYSTLHGTWTFQSIITQLARQGILFLLTPLALFASIPSLLIVESAALGLPIIVLYEISVIETGNRPLSLAVSACYFLYFPLAGANWFDFHFQTLFVLLFLVAYYLFLKKRFLLSSLLFILAGTVRFPYMGMVSVALLGLALPAVMRSLRTRRLDFSKGERMFLFLGFIMLAVVVLQYVWLTHSITMFVGVRHGPSFDPFINFEAKLLAILFLLGPLLFLPLLSKKWFIPVLLFIALIFFMNNPSFEYPMLFTGWYSVAAVPFLFLGFVDFVSSSGSRNLADRSSRIMRALTRLFPKMHIMRKKTPWIALTVLCVLALFLQPYGPMNDHSFNNFKLVEQTSGNSTLYADSMKLIDLIPSDEEYVLLQNNMPQFFPRSAITDIVVAPYNIGPNVTMQDIVNDTFPFYGKTSAGFIPITYALADLNGIRSLTSPPFEMGFPTMLQLVQMLTNSSCYGIVGELHGLTLLERNYTGKPVLYEPLSVPVSLSDLNQLSSSNMDGTLQFNSAPVDLPLWYGPYVYLPPGEYNVSLNLLINTSHEGDLSVVVGSQNSSGILSYITQDEFSLSPGQSPVSLQVSVEFTATNFLNNVQVLVFPLSETHSITVNSIIFNQTGALF